MSQELIGIIIAAIALAAILVPTMRGLRQDIESVRKDIAALGDRLGKVELGLVERIGKLESVLGDRISKVEGFLFERARKSSPTSQ